MKLYGGLTWPDEGNPAFFCLVAEKKEKAEDKLEKQEEYLEIIKEIESHSLIELLDLIKDTVKQKNKIDAIYAQNDKKYISYILEFSRWKRENSIEIPLRMSQTSSFEAGVLKIKDLIKEKKLKFPDDSTVKAQLRVFSNISLKNEKGYYAVSSLTHIIAAFRKRITPTNTKIPSIKAWY